VLLETMMFSGVREKTFLKKVALKFGAYNLKVLSLHPLSPLTEAFKANKNSVL